MVTTLDELRNLLTLLREQGVLHAKLGDIELVLGDVAPNLPVPDSTQDSEEDGWRGTTLEERRLLGLRK